MRKVPTVFRRDPDDMRRVLPEVTPGCEWVLADEGRATRKYDGTCVMRVIRLGEIGWEGIVWHHADGRMAKLKARDFPEAGRA